MMLSWLLQQLNIGGDFVGHLGEARFAFARPLIFWIGLALLVPVGWFIWSRQRANLPSAVPWLRTSLTACRVAVLFLMIFILADPRLTLEQTSEKKPIVAVMFDHSESMQLPAGPFEPGGETTRIAAAAGYKANDGPVDSQAVRALNAMARLKLAQTVVTQSAPRWLGPLAEKFDVQFWSFGRQTAKLGIDDPAAPALPDVSESERSTHLGAAIHAILDEAAGRPVAGMVLLTDGQNTGGPSPADAASRSAAAGVPIFAVPAGSTARLKDVSIVDLFTTGQVAVGDTVRVAVTIESTGFDKRPVKVELRDGKTLLDSKDLVLRSSEQQQIELTFQAKEAGSRALTVTVPPQPEEVGKLAENNSDTAIVRVTEEKLRVLFLEGLPRWDFRFLKNSIRRDTGLAGRDPNRPPDVVLETEWRRLPESEQAKMLPATLDELAVYHTIILGDVSPNMLTPAFVDLLAQAVREKGVGLIVEAGPLAMPHAYGEALQNLLPVRLGTQPGLLPQGRPFRIELTPDGSVNEAMRFYDDPGRNQSAWSQMQPYGWAADAERLAPAAIALAVNASLANDYGKLPLIASHQAGVGRVMFVGTDSTWLWRANVGDRFFYKFWGQSIRSVARKDEVGKKQSWLEVHPARAQPGEQARIELMAYDANGTPRGEPKLRVRVTGGTGTAAEIDVDADPLLKGRYTGRFPLPSVGDYRFSFASADAGEREARVRVLIAAEELRFPSVNRTALEQLAGATVKAGGRVVDLPDLSEIGPTLKGETRVTSFKREATVWDNWMVLVLLVGIYSFDVGLRRLSGLS